MERSSQDFIEAELIFEKAREKAEKLVKEIDQEESLLLTACQDFVKLAIEAVTPFVNRVATYIDGDRAIEIHFRYFIKADGNVYYISRYGEATQASVGSVIRLAGPSISAQVELTLRILEKLGNIFKKALETLSETEKF